MSANLPVLTLYLLTELANASTGADPTAATPAGASSKESLALGIIAGSVAAGLLYAVIEYLSLLRIKVSAGTPSRLSTRRACRSRPATTLQPLRLPDTDSETFENLNNFGRK
jgi:hypothetical protein